MAIESYTSFDDIRAALGVEDDEIRDATLSLDLYSNHLDAELESISLDLPGDYATVVAIDLSARTAPAQRFYRSTRMFAAAALAKLAAGSLGMSAPKEVSDEKTTLNRFALDPYKETKKNVDALYARYLLGLRDAYGAYKSSGSTAIVIPTLLAVSGLNIDPVTNT